MNRALHRGAAAAAAAALAGAVGCGPAAGSRPRTFRLAYAFGPSELGHAAAERFARRLGELSGGALSARLYPSGQLGNEREIVEGLKLGSVDRIVSGQAIISWFASEYGAMEAPFVWRDADHVRRVWDGPIGEDLRRVMRERASVRLFPPLVSRSAVPDHDVAQDSAARGSPRLEASRARS